MKHAMLKDSNKPWNLRTRRSANKTKNFDEYLKFDCITKNMETVSVALEKTTGDDVGKRERDKFSATLSEKEMEHDFAVFGQRLHRRPKKRLRVVQKQVDTLLPGLLLREVTLDMYKVVETTP